MPKPLHYLTTDPVNANAAEALAAGLPLEAAEPRDLPRLRRPGALVILDWDHLPADSRAALLDAVEVLGVHGYNLSDSVTRFLAARGVVVGRRLDEPFVTALARLHRAA